MGSRFYWLERKVLLAFAIAVLALALIGAFSVVGLAVAFSLLMGSLVIQDAWGTAKPRGISDRLAAVVESSDDAIISKTLDRIITSRNPAAERLFGYATTEAIGRSMLIVIPPERAHEPTATRGRGERILFVDDERVLLFVGATNLVQNGTRSQACPRAKLLCEHCGKIRTATTLCSLTSPCEACLVCNSPSKSEKSFRICPSF